MTKRWNVEAVIQYAGPATYVPDYFMREVEAIDGEWIKHKDHAIEIEKWSNLSTHLINRVKQLEKHIERLAKSQTKIGGFDG